MRTRFFQYVGRVACCVRFNRCELVQIDGRNYWVKQRRFGSAFLVLLANAFAKAIGLPMRMLGEGKWISYERIAFREMLELETMVREGKQLLLPQVEGQPLVSILTSSTTQQKIAAVQLATRELARLHRCRLPHPWTGGVQHFSHADATPGNVFVDLARGQATWLDFETVHPPEMPARDRHADDLRTLLCGFAFLSASDFSAVVSAALDSYDGEEVLTVLAENLADWNRRPSLRDMAMPALGTEKWTTLLQALSRRHVALPLF